MSPSPSPSLCRPPRHPHRLPHCVAHCVSLTVSLSPTRSHTDSHGQPLPRYYAPIPPPVRTQRRVVFVHAPLERLLVSGEEEDQAVRDLHASRDAARFAVDPPMRSSDDSVRPASLLPPLGV